jgi:hypothetical protein
VANSLTRLPPLVLGGTLSYRVRLTSGVQDWSARPCYLTLCRSGSPSERIVLRYVPGGTGNDGERVQIGGIWYVRFAKTIEWVRANLRVGQYELWVRPGPDTGQGQNPARPQRVVEVIQPIDGVPL